MKKTLLFVIILSFIIPVLTLAGPKYEEKDILLSLLKDMEGEFLEGDIVINGTLTKEFMDENRLKVLGQDIKNKLGLLGEEIDPNMMDLDLEGNFYAKEEIFDIGYNQINYYGYENNQNPLTIILSSYDNGERGETYLYINLIKREHFFGIDDIIKKVRSIFDLFEQPLEITTCIIGSFDGKLDEKSINNKGIKALKSVKGKIVEEYKDDYLLSYTAYTPIIEKYLEIGNKKVNLNLAIRYNEYEDKTYIWIGTPIITTGY